MSNAIVFTKFVSSFLIFEKLHTFCHLQQQSIQVLSIVILHEKVEDYHPLAFQGLSGPETLTLLGSHLFPPLSPNHTKMHQIIEVM